MTDKKLKENLFEADNLLNKNKPLEAVLLLKKTLVEFPNFPYMYYLLGIARMKCGLICLAKRAFEIADKLDPNNPENLKNLGWAKIMLGEVESGRDDLRSAINLNLIDSTVYLDLAMSYFNCLEFDKAFAWLDRAKALDPKDKLIIDNYNFVQEMKKEFLELSETQRKKIKIGKLDPEIRKDAHISALREVFNNRDISKEEAEELEKELELSGLSEKMLIYKDNINMMKKESIENIYKKREKIESNLLALIKESNVKITLDSIKKIIYNEKNHSKEIEKILQLINDAWNYFPHKCLKGLSPAEMVLKYSKK